VISDSDEPDAVRLSAARQNSGSY